MRMRQKVTLWVEYESTGPRRPPGDWHWPDLINEDVPQWEAEPPYAVTYPSILDNLTWEGNDDEIDGLRQLIEQVEEILRGGNETRGGTDSAADVLQHLWEAGFDPSGA